MKTIILFLLITTTSAFAQSDTAKQIIRLNFTQDHIAYMGAELSMRNTLNDKRIHDTLAARIGSGTKEDSVTTGGYPAGFVLRFFQQLADEQTGAAYNYFRDLVNGKTGYVGILFQLNTQVQNGNLTALWLRRELNEMMKRKEAVLKEKKQSGIDYLKTPLE